MKTTRLIVLVMLVSLALAGAGLVRRADAQKAASTKTPPPTSTAKPSSTPAMEIVDLFDNNGTLTIESVEGLNERPIFQNPILLMTISVKTTRQKPLGVTLNGYPELTLVGADAQTSSPCRIVVVGIATDDGKDIRTTPITLNPSEQTKIQLFGFCEYFNLPVSQGKSGDPFPTDKTYQLNRDQLIGESLQKALKTLVDHARKGDCTAKNAPQALGLQSLSTQLAVFLLFSDITDQKEAWHRFVDEAHSEIYNRDKEAIYCLLENNVVRPDNTVTPTAPPSPTALVTPSITPSPVSLGDIVVTPDKTLLGIVPPGTTLGQIALAMVVVLIVGSVVLVVFSAASSTVTRRMVIVALVVAVILGVILLFLRGSSPPHP